MYEIYRTAGGWGMPITLSWRMEADNSVVGLYKSDTVHAFEMHERGFYPGCFYCVSAGHRIARLHMRRFLVNVKVVVGEYEDL